jgi:hypothetical protein
VFQARTVRTVFELPISSLLDDLLRADGHQTRRRSVFSVSTSLYKLGRRLPDSFERVEACNLPPSKRATEDWLKVSASSKHMFS